MRRSQSLGAAGAQQVQRRGQLGRGLEIMHPAVGDRATTPATRSRGSSASASDSAVKASVPRLSAPSPTRASLQLEPFAPAPRAPARRWRRRSGRCGRRAPGWRFRRPGRRGCRPAARGLRSAARAGRGRRAAPPPPARAAPSRASPRHRAMSDNVSEAAPPRPRSPARARAGRRRSTAAFIARAFRAAPGTWTWSDL